MTKLLTVLAACGAFIVTPAVASAQSAFTLGGTIINLRGSGLTLSTNGQNVTIPASATSFTFPTAFASGTVYNVTMTTRPGSPTQGCLIANNRGTLTANVTNIQLACVTSRFTVGGTITGLRGQGLKLSTNGQTLAVNANGTFTFPTTILSGTAYNVAIVTQPYTPNQRCVVTNGSGTVTDGAISNIAVDCFSLEITGSTPAAGAIDVSRAEPLVLNFSAPLNALTVAPNWVDLLSFPNGHRGIDLSGSGSQLTLTPQMAMLPGTAYTLEVRPGIRAVGGEGMAGTAQVTFTTREASWLGAQDIAPGGGPFYPHIASKGDTFVTVWRQDNSMLALNRYSPRTGWGNAAFLSTHWFIVDPQVFLDDAGTAHVIWEHNDGTLVSSRHTTDGGWSAIEPIATDGMGSPRRWKGAMDDAGNIIAVWSSETATAFSVWANRYVPGSGWGTPVPLAGPSTAYIYDLNVAVDSAGNAVAYWKPAHSGQPRLMSRRYAPSSGWGSAEFANTDDGGVGSVPHMVIRAGEAVAVYSGSGGIMANTHRGSGWQVPEPIARWLAGSAFWPQVAFDDGGNVFAVWIQRGNGPTDEVWGNARSASGVWSTPRRIAVSTEKFEELRLAMDPQRRPLIIVKDVNATSSSVLTGRYRPGAGWLVETIEIQSRPMIVHTPRIHIDASGSALAFWATRSSGGGGGHGHARADVLE